MMGENYKLVDFGTSHYFLFLIKNDDIKLSSLKISLPKPSNQQIIKTIMQERIAIIGGFRTPMGKAGGAFKNINADDLAANIVKELIIKTGVNPNIIDEVIIGNVANPGHAANIARIIALKA